jgi:GntR family transcriptional regulator
MTRRLRERPALRTGARRPPEIVRGPGATVHTQIEDWLAGQIAMGALVPGDRLPTEHDLAGWFGVSRMTLRQALAELVRRGLVTKTVGRHGGTFVAAPKLEQDLTTLAGFSEQLRRNGMAAGARVLAARPRPAGPAAAAALRTGPDDPVFEVSRIRLADGKPVALERSLFPADRFPGLLDSPLEGSPLEGSLPPLEGSLPPLEGSLYELLEVRYGLRPHRARESLEPVTAGGYEAGALEVAVGAALMLVERVAYDQSGEPFEYARDLFRGDRTRVVMWTSGLAAETLSRLAVTERARKAQHE